MLTKSFITLFSAVSALGAAIDGNMVNLRRSTPYRNVDILERAFDKDGHLVKRCNAYNKGLPTPTGTVTSSSVITVNGGVFDGMSCLDLFLDDAP